MSNPEVHKQRLVSDLQAVVAEAEALLKATAGQAGEGAEEVRHRIKASLERARRNLVDIEEAALEKAKAAGRATDAYVHENPWQSIGVAAGVGLLLGLLIGRR
ncbi:MAG: DUF883 domain-containing protein [Methylibium sp.]|nr:DUF883 domain-containing protein [Methylibium sp.]